MMNMLSENPMTPISPNQTILKNPKRLAAMGLGNVKYDAVMTPKNENISATNPLSRAFEQEKNID